MRLFIAVELSEELKKGITGTRHEMKKLGGSSIRRGESDGQKTF